MFQLWTCHTPDSFDAKTVRSGAFLDQCGRVIFGARKRRSHSGISDIRTGYPERSRGLGGSDAGAAQEPVLVPPLDGPCDAEFPCTPALPCTPEFPCTPAAFAASCAWWRCQFVTRWPSAFTRPGACRFFAQFASTVLIAWA